MMLVTHRGPYRFRPRDDGTFESARGAGGIVSALLPLLCDPNEPGSSSPFGGDPPSWVAAAIDDGDLAATQAGAATVEGLDLHLLALDPILHRMHYDVVSNAVLWYLHHGLFDLTRRPRFDHHFQTAWEGYVAVNATFADTIVARAGDGERVIVHDYQLALVPGMVRAARPDLRLAHFTHTPFCGPNSIRVLPTHVARELCGSMAAVPAGFHTTRWMNSYEASARLVLDADAEITPPFAVPLGPDPAALARLVASPPVASAAAELDELVGDRRLILRSDRIDPAKNIVRGFLAYDRLFEIHPEWRERVVFVALLNRSRQHLAEYVAYQQEVEQTAERVNNRWGTGEWQPIVVDTRDDYEQTVAGLTRYDVLLVNSLKDGLNLVAKEGPIVNARHGVLALSPEAGAYDDLAAAALAVHPYDIEQAASVLHVALAMPDEERTARATRLRKLAGAHNPQDWLAELLSRAR
jgi:trehalose 6-phosphate synthase